MANSRHSKPNRNRSSNRTRSTSSKTNRNKRTKREEMDRTRRFSAREEGLKSNKKPNEKKIANSETKVLKSTSELNNKKGKKKKQRKHPKLMLALKIFIILFLLMVVAVAGVVAAFIFGMFGTDFEIKKEDLVISASNSKIVDRDGNVIADLSGDERRKIITLDQMADYLPKAYVAIEDERFYEHDGVDFKRTAGAILGKIFGKGGSGGSTITQQLVKNITKDDETDGFEGIKRKVKEWAKAYQVEKMISKDQILELYLNILYVGGEGNLHGVELGAEYYFNKSAKDLSLAECSFLAGINSSPNYYNPYKLYSSTDTEEKRTERIRSKCLTVLAKMKEVGFITNEDEYNQAREEVNAGLKFEKAQTNVNGVFSYHTDALIEQLIKQVMEEKACTREIAENYIYGSGLTIYSTVDPSVQAIMEEEFANTDKYQITSSKSGASAQAGMAVIDYKTGNVLGVAGGLGTKKDARGLNRATQALRQTGSVMKPLCSVAPGLEEKIIQTSTIYADSYTDFGGGYKPHNYNYFRGLINIRQFIITSQNIPSIKIMAELTPSKSIDYLRKMGITTLYKSGESENYNDETLPLAIGGISRGISPFEMTVAYGTLANGGECVTPTFYSKVVDAGGNVVMTPNQTRTRAVSPQNAYITTNILQDVVSQGTATYCKVPGIETAAKTGTTDDYKDRWLCGYTPYYSAACWYGYDDPEHIYASGNPAGNLWAAVMKRIHDPLPNAEFERPDGIVTASVCSTTGCLATEGCTDVYTDIFTQDNMPPKCEGHEGQEICTESGKLATEYCPEKEFHSYGVLVPKERLNLWTPLEGTEGGEQITEICDIHKKPEEPKPEVKPAEDANKENKDTKKDENDTSGAGNGGKPGTGDSTEGSGTTKPETGEGTEGSGTEKPDSGEGSNEGGNSGGNTGSGGTEKPTSGEGTGN
ncbi:MAG: transglycosylase domain-containing protein [Clostridia bacterium]|nr:transglycosylase domain-containing protein [Clostridia bacterium]